MKIPKNNKNTKIILEKFKEEKFLQEIAIGKILGDGCINDTGNLNFCHSIKQKEYMEHCYDLFKDYTRSGIKVQNRKRNNVPLISLTFDTKAIFKDHMTIFYIYDEIKKKRIKIIPLNIKDLITPASLAFWIMDDGYFNKPHIQLCTHSFTYDEVNLLKDVLESKFLLKCKIPKEKIRDTGFFWYILKIRKESLNLLWELVGKYILPTMKYKFGK